MRRLKYRLPAFLIAFGIGLAIDSALIFSVQIPKVEVIDKTFVSSLEPVKPEVINGEIEIKYESSLYGVDSIEAVFKVTNKTAETIYYRGYDKTDNRESWIKQNGKIKYIETPQGAETTQQELKPQESTYFWIAAPLNEKPFEAGFVLRTGEQRRERTISMRVKKHLKPKYCIEREADGVIEFFQCGTL
jgi:hypothetical protein